MDTLPFELVEEVVDRVPRSSYHCIIWINRFFHRACIKRIIKISTRQEIELVCSTGDRLSLSRYRIEKYGSGVNNIWRQFGLYEAGRFGDITMINRVIYILGINKVPDKYRIATDGKYAMRGAGAGNHQALVQMLYHLGISAFPAIIGAGLAGHKEVYKYWISKPYISITLLFAAMHGWTDIIMDCIKSNIEPDLFSYHYLGLELSQSDINRCFQQACVCSWRTLLREYQKDYGDSVVDIKCFCGVELHLHSELNEDQVHTKSTFLSASISK